MKKTKEKEGHLLEAAIQPMAGEPDDALRALAQLVETRATTGAPMGDLAALHAATSDPIGSADDWAAWSAKWAWAARVRATERRRIADSITGCVDIQAEIEASLERSQRAQVAAAEKAVNAAIEIFDRSDDPGQLQAAARMLATAHKITSDIDDKRGRVAVLVAKIAERMGVALEEL